MISECVGALLVAILVGIAGKLLVLGAKNRQKYEFFKKNAPGLKVVKDPSLFGGHTNKILNAKYNWAKMEQLLDEYGPTVGFFIDSRPAVITTDLDFIKTFIVDEQVNTNRIKLGLPLRELEEDCILFAEDEQWLRLRKAIAPAFSAHKIKSSDVQSDISRIIDKFIGMIELRLDEAKQNRQENFIEEDTEDICHRFSLALVFTNFYKQYDMIDFQSKEDDFVSMVERNLRNLIGLPLKACAAFPLLKRPLEWLVLNFHEQGKARNVVMNLIKQQTKLNFEANKQAQERSDSKSVIDADNFTLKDGSKFKRNMIDYITDQYREGKLTTSEYFNSTFFLFFAADKTVSDALSRLLFNLAYHQDVQEKLRQSIVDSGVDSEYLSWVINETLRMNPPVSSGCSRTLRRDIQTKHGLVPAGTFVVTPAYTIGRLKEYWGDDSNEFKPERWANAKSFHPVQYLAFGSGRRACPGKELAMLETKMLISALIRKYKFDKSQIHTLDNSQDYTAPLLTYLVYHSPTYVRISRLATQ